MDRQPLTDRLGDRLLAEYGGAAAAYSLRALNGNGDNVVRVRRASDNDEKDFTAEQIELGEMVNWVNSQTVPPLDIGVETSEGRIPVPEGGTSIGTPAAAYSLRNLSTTYTGNVVDVRRSSDGAEESFTAAEVSDGTLESWVNTDVVTISSDFSSGTDSFLAASNCSVTGNVDGILGEDDFLRATATSSGGKRWTRNNTLSVGGSFVVTFKAYAPPTNPAVTHIVEASGAATGSTLVNISSGWTNVEWLFDDFAGNFNNRFLMAMADAGGEYLPASTTDVVYIKDVVVTQTKANGTVSKWYDQSGNTNHAVQTTPANQPTIVEGGSLVTGGIDFDGVDDRLTCPSLYSSDISIFNVATTSNTVNTDNYMRMIHLCDGNDSFQLTRGGIDDLGKLDSRNTAFQSGVIAFKHGDINGINLISAITSSTDTDAYIDGSLQSNGSTTLGSGNNTTTTIGARDDLLSSSFFAGSHAEIIIYDTDQSANRTAIEANIGETYGITGIPAYDNTVDGFVETWYDQSGNGRDATQSVAGNQPKIVDGGSLVAGGIDFDGVDDKLVNTSLPFQDGSIATVAKADVAGAASNYLYSGTTHLIGSRSNGTNLIFQGSLVSSANLLSADEQLRWGEFGATDTLFINGISEASGNAGSNSFASDTIYIGGNGSWDGKINEIILWSTSQSANRTAIEANINAHYNIYP